MKGCACRTRDAYDCWRSRYPEPTDLDEGISDREAIQSDGGPCGCSCHDETEED